MSSVGSFFEPSAETARSIDQKVRRQLAGSLAWLGETFEAMRLDPSETEGWVARPVDFGFYFELASAVHHDGASASNEETQTAIDNLLSSVRRETGIESDESPLVKTMSAKHYNQAEHDTLIRWFDLEPDNRMALLPLNDEELQASTEDLQKAIRVIGNTVPEVHGELIALTREIIFAKPGPEARMKFGGASSYALWGALALNGKAHDNWWEYAPRIVHEYSHNLLFGIASNEALVLNEPEERYPSPLRHEKRPIDGIFHACYVSARETFLMDELLKASSVVDIEDEALEAFAETQKRSAANYADCRAVLDEHAKYTGLGQSVLDDTSAYMNGRH